MSDFERYEVALGVEAFCRGEPRSANPFTKNAVFEQEARDWDLGWVMAYEQSEKGEN